MRGTGPAVVSQTGGKSHHGTRNVGWRRKETRVSMETTREEPGSADSSVSAQENPGQASSPRGPSGDATFALYRAAKSAAGGPGSNGGATAVASPRLHWRGGSGAAAGPPPLSALPSPRAEDVAVLFTAVHLIQGTPHTVKSI